MTCLCCTEPDLFSEDLVELTGLREHIPDLLWGATVGDLKGIQPGAVYSYDWREVDRATFSELLRKEYTPPHIDLQSRGVYIGIHRDVSI